MQTSPSSAEGRHLPEAVRGPNHEHLWDFHNIRMLVSSDLAIFGDGSHPAVSLRVRDST